MFSQDYFDHDEWAHGTPKVRNAGKIELGPVLGVLPFDGVRNPITTSSTSHKVTLKYKTAANNWQPKIGLAESHAEAAVAHEALIFPGVHDVEFQPVRFQYPAPSGAMRWHTIDLRFTFQNGLKVFVFVRNSSSLAKPQTQDEIAAIRMAAPASEAHRFAVIDADAYSRARRDNLRQMHHAIMFEPDPEADEIVEDVAHHLKTLWRISDLFPLIDLQNARIFKGCLRLIARGILVADMGAVIGPTSRIWRAAA